MSANYSGQLTSHPYAQDETDLIAFPSESHPCVVFRYSP